MQRRAFLKTAAVSLALASLPRSRRARAQASSCATPFLVVIEARGAWDPTCLCDPQGQARDVFTFYDAAHIGTTSTGLRYAPFDVVGGAPSYYQTGGQDFFQKYAADLLVINGVDTQTVSHEVGPRHVLSGHIREGHPALSGLLAAARGASLPMALISSGGFDSTAGLVPVTRAGRVDALKDLSRPYRIRPSTQTRFLDETTEVLVAEAGAARAARLGPSLGLRRRTDSLNALQDARAVEPAFAALAEALDGVTPVDAAGNAALPFAQTALVAMAAGVSVAAHLGVGSFDTHDLHDSLDPDDGHRPQVQRLLEVIDFVAEAVRADSTLSSRGVLVVVGSDFARTRYNADDPSVRGKDHWPVTSMMLMGLGAASALVQGGRVIGETTVFDEDGAPYNGARARRLKVEDGVLVPTTDGDPQGIALTPAHVHQALRAALLCSSDDEALLARFPLAGVPANPLPILAEG